MVLTWFIIGYSRQAWVGNSLDSYIATHGMPSATAQESQILTFRLKGIRFTGVQVTAPFKTTLEMSGRLLLYPESERAIQHLVNFPVSKLRDESRSTYYIPMFGSEYIVIVRVSVDGRIANVERIRYGCLSFYEGAFEGIPKYR